MPNNNDRQHQITPTIKFSPHLQVNVPQPAVQIAIPSPSRDWWLTGSTLAAVGISLILGISTIYFTRRQLKLFEQQNLQAKTAATTDERPWLTVSSAHISTDNPLHLPGDVIHIKNTGKTPALEVRVMLLTERSPRIENKVGFTRDEVQSVGPAHQNIVGPNDEKDLTDLSFSGAGLPQPLAGEVANRTRAMAVGTVVIQGAVSYTDLNKSKGFTQFCFLLHDNEVIAHCVSGDSME